MVIEEVDVSYEVTSVDVGVTAVFLLSRKLTSVMMSSVWVLELLLSVRVL